MMVVSCETGAVLCVAGFGVRHQHGAPPALCPAHSAAGPAGQEEAGQRCLEAG